MSVISNRKETCAVRFEIFTEVRCDLFRIGVDRRIEFQLTVICRKPIPVAARSAAARLLGLRVRLPLRGMDVCLVSVVCCQVEVSASG
jgi:hypothetical protein